MLEVEDLGGFSAVLIILSCLKGRKPLGYFKPMTVYQHVFLQHLHLLSSYEDQVHLKNKQISKQ